MDSDEWVFLSDEAFLDFDEVDFDEDDGDEKQIFLGKRKFDARKFGSKSVFDMDYFCPSPNSQKMNEPSRNPTIPNHLVPIPIRLEPRIENSLDNGLVKETTKDKDPVEVTVVVPLEKIKASVESDQDTLPQVFFKIKENEFVDMKMDSPKSCSRGLLPPVDEKGEGIEIVTSPRMKKIEKEMVITKEEEGPTWEENGTSGFNIWKWSLTGVGAICSFGVAAAAICVLFFGSQQRTKLQQDHKIRFQIYADDKRIKQVVQHATKLNDAVSALRGVPLNRAHITYAGYYDGL